jgi:hypothetical protein
MASEAPAPETVNSLPNYNSPDQFELKGHCAEVIYSTSNIAGIPQFSYRDHQRQVSVSGEDIRTLQTEIGELVTVTLEVIPDFQEVTFTLLLPTIHLPPEHNESPIRTEGILTTARSSIAGPRLMEGQVENYCAMALHGTAKLVAF